MLAEYRPCWNTFPERVPVFHKIFPECQTSWNNIGCYYTLTKVRPLLPTVPRKCKLTKIGRVTGYYGDRFIDPFPPAYCAQHE